MNEIENLYRTNYWWKDNKINIEYKSSKRRIKSK